MRIGISLKWTLSSILLVIMVVLAYTYIMRNDTEESVTQETARIQGIQNNALDGLGAQTTKTVSLPASSLMFDNDLEGLRGLLNPIVAEREAKDESYIAVYASIIAPDGRVWVTVANPQIERFDIAGKTFFDRSQEDGDGMRVEKSYVDELAKNIKNNKTSEDTKRHIVRKGGSQSEADIRQYAVAIEPKRTDEDADGDDHQRRYLQGSLIWGTSDETNDITGHRQTQAIDFDHAFREDKWKGTGRMQVPASAI